MNHSNNPRQWERCSIVVIVFLLLLAAGVIFASCATHRTCTSQFHKNQRVTVRGESGKVVINECDNRDHTTVGVKFDNGKFGYFSPDSLILKE